MLTTRCCSAFALIASCWVVVCAQSTQPAPFPSPHNTASKPRKADRTPDQAAMPLRKKPVRPMWRPLYATRDVRIDSWTRFVSEAYWNVELEE